MNGDCLEKLRELDDNSVDSIVTDPPYHLTSIVERFGKKNSAPAQYGTDGAFQRASKGFMGKEWDGGDIAFRPQVWEECMRVLKPGGYLLAFGGSRTYHRLAVAVEDAGFEIRDQIMWVYGSGFPKSHNVGKAVDKLQGNKREVTGERKQSGAKFKTWSDDPNETRWHNQGFNDSSRTSFETTKGNSDWEGWGTALKPAHEPIVMARKPFKGTVAKNVLEHGTGAINIDGCRVSYENDSNDPASNPLYRYQNDYKQVTDNGQKEGVNVKFTNSLNPPNEQGRFPANFIHDGSDEVVELFPDSKTTKSKQPKGTGGIWSSTSNTPCGPTYGDEGSAARFFYCAKASKKDRNAGCENLPEQQYSHDGRDKPIENAFQRNESKASNNHPTVKPNALMRYLCRLVTQPGGVVLDPFMGSGSTGRAAIEEGFQFIGIEREPEYFSIAQARCG